MSIYCTTETTLISPRGAANRKMLLVTTFCIMFVCCQIVLEMDSLRQSMISQLLLFINLAKMKALFSENFRSTRTMRVRLHMYRLVTFTNVIVRRCCLIRWHTDNHCQFLSTFFQVKHQTRKRRTHTSIRSSKSCIMTSMKQTLSSSPPLPNMPFSRNS
jgi:hypothetical protein